MAPSEVELPAAPEPGWRPAAGRSPLPRKLRVIRRGDFQRAFRDGSRARGSSLLVVAAPNGLAYPRIGLSVGKRIWKSAVRRNRIRRQFREAFRLERERLPAGYDLVLIPGRPQLVVELAALREELVQLAAKAARRSLEKLGASGAPPQVREP